MVWDSSIDCFIHNKVTNFTSAINLLQSFSFFTGSGPAVNKIHDTKKDGKVLLLIV